MARRFGSDGLPTQTVYLLRIGGHLGPEWVGWFHGMTIDLQVDGDSLLTGPLVDQAALYGVLKRLRELGLPLLSVVRVAPDSTTMEVEP